MEFTIITLFPQIIKAYLEESIIKRALIKNLVTVKILDLRTFSDAPHHQVDDYQFGGGLGMVLKLEPLIKALESCQTPDSEVWLLSPQGEVWNQKLVKKTIKDSLHKNLILICGHYEGFDERLYRYIDREISVGDYILTGGELPALTLVDSLIRLVPGVLKPEAVQTESFENQLFDYPVYTKPLDFRGDKVPAVLLSGHHANIQKFREEMQLLKTYQKRPELIQPELLTAHQLAYWKKIKKGAK